MEERLRKLEETVAMLQKQLEEKEEQIQALLDIEAIKRVQRAYGYYLERWMYDEIVDLFADHPEVSATFVEGTYLGLEGVRRYFGKAKDLPPEFFHQVMQVSPIITLSEDRQRAKGRWYGYGTLCSFPQNNTIDPTYMSVIYEMEYIKQDGVWKILKLAFQMHYAYQPSKELKKLFFGEEKEESVDYSQMGLSPDIWAEYDTQYPSGYIYPMHFVHPVTGKPTSEEKYNAKLQLKPSPFKPRQEG